MKVIVSHDVDHLYPSEHFVSDLIFPKFWVRSFILWVKGEIGSRTFLYRLFYAFRKRMNRIPEVCQFDINHGVKSTFFFGMDSILGMSYRKEKAVPWINYVRQNGFDVGVHGCEYLNCEKIHKEHADFEALTGIREFGVRNHYLRYDKDTFTKMEEVGYLYDTTEFNKTTLEIKDPYKIGKMWEFPLSVMDCNIFRGDLQKAKKQFSSFVDRMIQEKKEYLTLLFHDSYYDEKCYPKEKEFYEWMIHYLENAGVIFVSYNDAICELDNNGKH